jgi:rhomboid protease GluP
MIGSKLASLKLKYNAPLTLSYMAASFLVLVLGLISNGGKSGVLYAFTVGGELNLMSVEQWFRFFSHILGHANYMHFFQNFTILLLIGPMLEEKYGIKNLIIYILITAFITGFLQTILFTSLLLGASGIVFMFIVLASMSNFKSGEIPLTFVLIIIIYIGNEIVMAVSPADNISHYAHIMGGVCGTAFGFFSKKA